VIARVVRLDLVSVSRITLGPELKLFAEVLFGLEDLLGCHLGEAGLDPRAACLGDCLLVLDSTSSNLVVAVNRLIKVLSCRGLSGGSASTSPISPTWRGSGPLRSGTACLEGGL
jgi:hypothetical protein